MLTITETRPCKHKVGGYSLDPGRVKEPCPVCGVKASEIMFTVKDDAPESAEAPRA